MKTKRGDVCRNGGVIAHFWGAICELGSEDVIRCKKTAPEPLSVLESLARVFNLNPVVYMLRFVSSRRRFFPFETVIPSLRYSSIYHNKESGRHVCHLTFQFFPIHRPHKISVDAARKLDASLTVSNAARARAFVLSEQHLIMSALDNSHQLVKSEICSQPEEKDHGNETPGLIQPGFDEPALESNDEHESSSNWSPTKSPELIEVTLLSIVDR